jgi:preprotein translocase subunit SecG
MTGFVMFLHALISIFLIVVILMQSGRGGGLTEGFASAESLFGAKTNEFMIKTTTIFATVFLITCLGLAILSSQKGKSLMSSQAVLTEPVSASETVEKTAKEASAQLKVIEEKAATTDLIPEVSTEAPSEDIPVAVPSEAE